MDGSAELIAMTMYLYNLTVKTNWMIGIMAAQTVIFFMIVCLLAALIEFKKKEERK